MIGKHPTKCDIILNFREIDDKHAKIIIEKNDVTIEDLNSQGGIYKILPDESKK